MCSVSLAGRILHVAGISGELGRSGIEGASHGPRFSLSKASRHGTDKSQKHSEVR